jgi:NAD(P)-dependent dehydrogenase (short-subunit alcohol dehydrogenase family)
MHMGKLGGKTAIVTGASSGIGRAIAERFASEGAKVFGVSFGKPPADLPGVEFLRADVRVESDVRRAVEAVYARGGGLHILVNAAGISKMEGIEETSEADYDAVMDTNMKGVFLMTKACISHLKPVHGSVINVASKLALIPDAEVPVYCASKAAVAMFTKAMALQYAREGVRINAVCPGPVDTPLLQAYFANREEMIAYYAEHNPMGRIGTPEEVAEVALFLASENASFVTGGLYTVDGGGSLTN